MPRSTAEWALREHIASSLGVAHVKVEHVVSGSAIFRIWDFLIAQRRHAGVVGSGDSGTSGGAAGRKRKTDEEGDLARDLEAVVRAAADPPASIVAHAESDPTCKEALDMFVNALGAEAGNLAARFQAYGGVYIAGGATAKLVAQLTAGDRLQRAYLDKGRSVDAYRGCPLYVVTRAGDELGMDGAWAFARSALAR